jgi:glutamine amidotransferase
MILIIDYGMGNLRSVQKKLIRVGVECEISSSRSDIEAADKLILPGVGHFANGVEKLKSLGLWDVLNKKVLTDKTPILGICLGMQLMAKYSEEGDSSGLGWFDAKVVRFRISDKLKHKVPHMGWNNVILKKDSQLMRGFPPEASCYFVHSYYIECNDKDDILTSTDYECQFTSAIQKDNIYGTQFHPEKSHDWGEIILRNFAEL